MDEWQMPSNEKESICYLQPKTMSQRIAIANDFVRRFKFRIPMLVDHMDNRADELYSAWPERIYVVDETSRIAYKGGLGPFKYNPDELEKWLARRFPP
jgi:hypothetical protein